jgi:hypothetical protein
MALRAAVSAAAPAWRGLTVGRLVPSVTGDRARQAILPSPFVAVRDDRAVAAFAGDQPTGCNLFVRLTAGYAVAQCKNVNTEGFKLDTVAFGTQYAG